MTESIHDLWRVVRDEISEKSEERSMATERQKRAADLGALKRELKRKKAKLAYAEKTSGPTSGTFRRDLVTPKREYWREQVKILETEINKTEASGTAQKTKLK